ncbi:glutamate-1-semialdehyde 2,1-aminomutase [Prauserella coralliicola]|nr:glutamate-1-semialdehyde 2,1-aminomutase [Prauserella coralliicola]
MQRTGPPRAHTLRDAVQALRSSYVDANPRSAERHELARRSMPGGNTRTTLYYEPFPLVFERAEGAHLYSLDGRRYLDLLGDYTAGLYGHSHPVLVKALHAALDEGVSFGGHTEREARFAAELRRRFPALELVRFTNSGTEANLFALAAARAHTGRSAVLVFRGGYHGGVLAFGQGGAPLNVPHRFLVGDYNDVDGAREIIAEAGDELAAVLVEPMLGSGGTIPGSPEFLRTLREETARAGALLIFDEIMTSRLAPGGLQQVLGITPDLTTLGKYLGGGMSFGAFGGRAGIMRGFDPSAPGPVWAHAGTFNNNTLTMAAGLAGLEHVLTDTALDELNARGERLRGRLRSVFTDADIPFTVTGRGSLMTFHPVPGPVGSPADLTGADHAARELLFFHLLEQGYWMARRAMVALSLAISDTDCDGVVAAFEEFADRYGAALRDPS